MGNIVFKIGNESKTQQEYQRAVFLKNTVCPQINAQYFPSIERIKDRFALEKGEIEKSNAITGEHEGYQYCLCEYYHIKSGKKTIVQNG